MKEAEPMFTTNEAAEMLDVTAARVRQMILAGLIQAEKKGRDLLIPKSQIEKARGRKTKRGPEKMTEEKKAALPLFEPEPARPKTKARAKKAARRSGKKRSF